jgi:tetratricopeptide (TPR) repeat protein
VRSSSLLSLALLWLFAAGASAQGTDPLAALDQTVTAAEASLREGELQRAESQYRAALYQGWMIVGGLHVAAGRLAEARGAFTDASRSAVDARDALHSLALVHLQTGNAGEAVTVLTRLAGRRSDTETDRLLAQAMMANGQLPEAVQTLEAALTAAPDDPEIAFILASTYLKAKKPDAAARLFATVLAARPGPETDVLVGRTYRDFGDYARARTALLRALKKDPRVRRAHYYLGTVAVLEEGVLRLDDAIREFRAELKLTPKDEVSNLRLGMALVEAQRHADAMPHLEIVTASATAPADAFYYLGRALMALGRTPEAVSSLQRAVKIATVPPVDEARLRSIYYQLALALRQAGKQDEAARYFDEARRASSRRAGVEREQLARYLTDVPDPAAAQPAVVPTDTPFAALTPAVRQELERRARTPIARAYFNLGIMHAQGQRFARAAELFEQASRVDPEFPGMQYSLGVAYFNSQRFKDATGPLSKALATDASNAALRRMLALAWFNAEAYDKAAALLEADADRGSNLSLQYTYGLALVRSDRAAEAEQIFSKLLAQHGGSAELQVVLGQAHAQQGDYEEAVASLTRALQLKPDVAEANTTLGIIYLKQGKLAEAASVLKAAVAAHPEDAIAQHTLATVLDLDGRSEEALVVLRRLLRVKPGFADARYLAGKILLAQGAARETVPRLIEEAIEQLEAAARIAPEDANIHYQLGQAYQKLGRAEAAERAFAVYRQLKDKRRGGMQP